MSLGLAESLQAQLALEIVIQVGPKLCLRCPGRGGVGWGRITDLIGW